MTAKPTLVALVEAGDLDGIQRLIDKAKGTNDQNLSAQISALKAELEEVRVEARRNSPFVDWPIYESGDDVIAQLGDDAILQIAMEEVRAENRDRVKKHHGSLYQTEAEQAKLAKGRINKIAAAIVAEQSKWVSDESIARGAAKKMRTFKMIAPRRHCDRHDEPVGLCYDHGSMRQIPVELQINNGAASLNDPIERYTRKGFKAVSPARCKLVDCYRVAAVTDGGEYAFGMYCSRVHQTYVEGSKQRTSAGNEVDLHMLTQR